MDAPDRFREDLARALRLRETSRVLGWRGDWRGEEGPEPSWPSREELYDATPALEPLEASAARGHLVRAHLDEALDDARERLREAGVERVRFERDDVPAAAVARQLGADRSVAEALRPLAERLARDVDAEIEEARAEASEYAGRLAADRGGLPAVPDAGPTDARSRAARFLDATDDAAEALASRAGVEDAADWARVLRDTQRGLHPDERRHRRVAATFADVDLHRALEHAVRLEASAHPFRARTSVVDPGRDVRLALSELQGVPGEVEAALGVGRALGYALVSPGLRPSLRWPLHGSVARSLGVLLARNLAEPSLGRFMGLSRRESEARRAILAPLLLLRARLASAAVVAPAEPDARAEAVARALCGSAPVGAQLVLCTSTPGARARSWRGGLALFGALRDHFDEDWFRNPRAAEVIRGACARGGEFSVEAWCQELGGDDPVTSTLELVG